MIKFENVTKSFKENPVLRSVNFTIKQGELAVFIGQSGCGKTTTLKMINRLINPTAGRITIHGEDIAKKNVIALRRSMGYVIQQTGLFPHLTIRENIEIIPRLERKSLAAITERSRELMNMVGLEPALYLDRYPSELSGGQQQRVGVVRAFATDPDIILMDEPFSALDPLTRSSLQDELINLQAQLQKTIVFVTHDMDEAIKIADRICIMDKGEIIQFSPPERILKNPANDFVSNFVGKNRLWATPEFIRARDIMVSRPPSCLPSIPIGKALQKMRLEKTDRLVVIDTFSHPLGIITQKDIFASKDQKNKVSETMNQTPVVATADQNITEILKIVEEHQINSVPVTDGKNVLIGLITKTGLLSVLGQRFLDISEKEEA